MFICVMLSSRSMPLTAARTIHAFGLLLDQVRGHVLVHILEHAGEGGRGRGLGALDAGVELALYALLDRGVLGLGVVVRALEVAAQPAQRIALLQLVVLDRVAVHARVVRRRVRAAAVRHVLEQGGALAADRALERLARAGVDRQR